MIKFPSIEQFRNVIRNVQHKAAFVRLGDDGEPIYSHSAKKPTLRFRGSVKLHGTNAAIVYKPDGVQFQSRERILTAESDNAGFYAHMSEHGMAVLALEDDIRTQLGIERDDPRILAVYGEWCGGNIQKGVAIAGLPKMFVIFAVKLDDEWQDIDAMWTVSDKSASIYNIAAFPQYDIEIDFEHPELAQNELIALTEQVEKECPVGDQFGVSGVGEGVVWRCCDPEFNSSNYWFKVKGEKHSASQVKTLAAVDVEVLRQVSAFVAATVTESRLEQGLQNLINEQQKPFEMTSMGDFIRWVFNDILKEEADTIVANGLDQKKLGGPIANAARRWFVEKYNADGIQKAA